MVWYSVVQWTDTQPITPYPRQVAGDGNPDPAYDTALNITAVTTNTITINVGTAV